MNMFIKVIKRCFIDYSLYIFLPFIFPRILIILYHTYVLGKKPQAVIDSFPPSWWIGMLVFCFIVSFIRVYKNNKNWPRKKKQHK